MSATERATRRRPRPLRAAFVALLAAALLGSVTTGEPTVRLVADEPSTAPEPTPVSAPIRIVQANIKSGMGEARTKADIAAVFRQKPDFVTYNEVTYRPDRLLVPAGYAMHRTAGAYTGETPVVWNTARWNMVETGTYLISNRMRPPGSKKKFELGLRYANWVTVQSNTGQTMSVVSTHFSPEGGYTEGITAPSFRRLGQLVAQLRARGPVLVGGDMNTNYKNPDDYPRAVVAEAGLTPTYDVLGTALPTGVYRNATIDYVFVAAAHQFEVHRHFVTTVNSDHRLLTADVALTGASAAAFVPGVVVNDPETSPFTVNRLVARALNLTPENGVIHIASRKLGGGNVVRAIKRAHARGAHVQVITGNRRLTKVDRQMRDLLGTRVNARSFFHSERDWRRYRLPAASVFINASGGTRALRIDVNRPITGASARELMRARITTDKPAYDKIFVAFCRAAGRRM